MKACAWCKGENLRAQSVTCCDNCARSWRRVRAKRARLFQPAKRSDDAPAKAPTTLETLLAKLESRLAELERVVALKTRIKDMEKQLGLFGDNA